MRRWVVLRTRFEVLGQVTKPDKWNAWLEAHVSWGSSVTAIAPREQWDQEQEERRAQAEQVRLRAERKAQKERDRLDPPIPDDLRGVLQLFEVGYGFGGASGGSQRKLG